MITNDELLSALTQAIQSNPYSDSWNIYRSGINLFESESSIRELLKGTGFAVERFYSGPDRPGSQYIDTNITIKQDNTLNPTWQQLKKYIVSTRQKNKEEIIHGISNALFSNPRGSNWSFSINHLVQSDVDDICQLLKREGFQVIFDKGYSHAYDSAPPSIKINRSNAKPDNNSIFAKYLREISPNLDKEVQAYIAQHPTDVEWRFNLDSIHDRKVVDAICQQLKKEGFSASYHEAYFHQLAGDDPAHITIKRHQAKPNKGIYSSLIQPVPRKKTEEEIAQEFSPEFIDFFKRAFPNTTYKPQSYFFDGYGHAQVSQTQQGYLFEARTQRGKDKTFLIPYAYDPFDQKK